MSKQIATAGKVRSQRQGKSMAAPLRIGLLSAHNPHDRNSFSGTAHYMMRALEAEPGVAVRVLGDHRPPGLWTRLRRRVFGRRAPDAMRIDETDLDWIVFVASARLLNRVAGRLTTPVAYVTDATPGFLRDFYGRDVPDTRVQEEKTLIGIAARVIYSSRYMAERAVPEFGLEDRADRLVSVPFGVNLDVLPPAPLPVPPAAPRRLLFIGKDWDRKGGALAVAAVEALAGQGVDARLTVVGCNPEGLADHPQVDVEGYLDKNTPQGAARLSGLFGAAHLFVLPTRADCTPMVVAEAKAHGLPVLITETGGIGSLMAPGRNGAMLPPAADGQAWAAAILDLVRDPEDYARLRQSSFAHCHDRLTWQAWARDVTAILRGDGS